MEQKDYNPAIPIFRDPDKVLQALTDVYRLKKSKEDPNKYLLETDTGNHILLILQPASIRAMRKVIIQLNYKRLRTTEEMAASELARVCLKILYKFGIVAPTGVLNHIKTKYTRQAENEFNGMFRLVFKPTWQFQIEAYDQSFTNILMEGYHKKYGQERYESLVEATKGAFLNRGV